MRKALLTSSEVSALISIVVVILFTMALFLSGYTIQQRTLQDLRLAIRPGSSKPSPKAHLPGYFKRETKQMNDGTIIVQESQADKDEKEHLAKKFELHAKAKSNSKAKSETKVPEMDQMPVEQVEERIEKEEPEEVKSSEKKGQATDEQLRILESIKKHAAQQAWGVDHPDPEAKNPLPITRAERRKLIKEEIQRLAQADRPVYYQRRLW